MNILYKTFSDIYTPHNYQFDALRQNKLFPNRSLKYNKNGYNFELVECNKFPSLFVLIRDDKNVGGILGPASLINSITLLSTRLGTAEIGEVSNEDIRKKADTNYVIEYAGNVVEIPQDDNIYLRDGKILIGWHGSYDPPHGM